MNSNQTLLSSKKKLLQLKRSQLQLQKAQENANDFIRYVGRGDDGQPLHQDYLQQSWHEHVAYCWENNVHPVILAPFGHGKSVQMAVYRPIFEIGQNQNIRVKVVSNNDENAAKRVNGMVNLIEESAAYKRVFPHIVKDPNPKKKWSGHTIFVKRTPEAMSIDPTLEAYGILGAGTGGRADLIIFDDIVDYKNAIAEPVMREKVKQAFKSVWMTRLSPQGRIIYINTRWHTEDLNGELITNPEFCVLQQAISDDFKKIECVVYNAPTKKHPIMSLLERRAA